MKKFLLAALLLSCVVLAGDRLGSALLRRLLLESQARFARLYHGGISADILVVGDSRAVNAVNPAAAHNVTGQTVFNLGYNGMSTSIAEALVADYLDHNPAPKLVLMEVTSLGQPPALINELKTFASF